MTAIDDDPERSATLGALVGTWLALWRADAGGEGDAPVRFARCTERLLARLARDAVGPRLSRHGLARGLAAEVALEWLEDCLLSYPAAFERAAAADLDPGVLRDRLGGLVRHSVRQHVTRLHADRDRDAAALHRRLRRTLGALLTGAHAVRLWLPPDLAQPRATAARPGAPLRQCEFRSARLTLAAEASSAAPAPLPLADAVLRLECAVPVARRTGLERDPSRLSRAVADALADRGAALAATDLFVVLRAWRPAGRLVALDPEQLAATPRPPRAVERVDRAAPRLAVLVRAARSVERDGARLGPLWRDAAEAVADGRSPARARRLGALVRAVGAHVEAELARRGAFARDLPLAAVMCEVLQALDASWPDERDLELLYRRRRWHAGRSQRAEDRQLVERTLRDLLGLPADGDGRWLPRAS